MMSFLGCGMFLMLGCDNVNYETKFESSSSVSVNSSSYKETKSESNDPFTFKVNDVNLNKGETEFYLSITNNTDKDVTLTGMALSFKAVDENNKPVREGNTIFENLSVKLPAGKEIYEVFVIEDDKVAAFNGGFNVDYTISNIETNPPLQ